MNKLRLGAVLLAAIGVGGCFPDQAKDVAACRSQADQFYQAYRAVDPDDPSSRYIIACMAAKGYDFTIARADCDSRYPLPTQPTCFTPNNWAGSLIDLIEHPRK